MVAPATLAKKDAPRGLFPRRVGPSAGFAGDSGAESRGGKSKRSSKKARKRKDREDAESGGCFLEPRGKVRREGVAIPVGTQRTCLHDSLWAALKAFYPQLKLDLEAVRTMY